MDAVFNEEMPEQFGININHSTLSLHYFCCRYVKPEWQAGTRSTSVELFLKEDISVADIGESRLLDVDKFQLPFSQYVSLRVMKK